MHDRSRSWEGRRSTLRSVVPFGLAIVLALGTTPVILAFLVDSRVDPTDLRLWVASVWLGGFFQVLVLLARRPMLASHSDRWEQVYSWVQLYVGAAWASGMSMEVTQGEELTFMLIIGCFLALNSAAGVVAFAGSPLIGRKLLTGLWLTTLIIASRQGVPGIVFMALVAWPVSYGCLRFANGLLRRSAREHDRFRQLSRDLALQAATDDLTGLLNRRATLQRLQQALDAGHGVTTLFINLDGFHVINDHYGHATGDTVLINVADQLNAIARVGDIVGRLGGDEFIVVLTEPADQHLADLIAQRYAGEISRSHGAIGELAVTASVGAARSIDGATAEDLLGCADAAMYRAKAHGGNTAVHFLEAHLD